MAATVKRSNDPAKTTTVKKEVTVRAEVERELPLKYLETSYQFEESSAFFTSQTA